MTGHGPSAGFYQNAGAYSETTPEQLADATANVRRRYPDDEEARPYLLALGLVSEPRKRPRNRDVMGRVVSR